MNRDLNSPKNVYKKVASTMRMESIPLNNSDVERIKNCVSGKRNFADVRQELIRKHTKAAANE